MANSSFKSFRQKYLGCIALFLETWWFIFYILEQVNDRVNISYMSHSILYVCFKGQISDIWRLYNSSVGRMRPFAMRKVYFGYVQKKCVTGQ